MSRDKFEAIYGPMGFDLTRMYVAVPEPWSEYEDEKTGYAWAGWLAGRESMRDEAAILCEGRAVIHYDYLSDECTSPQEISDLESHECAAAIREIEL